MSDDLISAEQAQVLLGEMDAVEIRELWQVPWDFSMSLARTVIAQAAEITRLRAMVDLLTKVERAAAALEAGLGEPSAKVGSLRVKLAAALATYQQTKEGGV